MTCHQTIVWIDEQEARISCIEDGLGKESTVLFQSNHTVTQEPAERDSASVDKNSYFHRVARALDIADEILIVGPSATKGEFARYMNKNDHAIDPRVLGVETIAQPNDPQLTAFAKLYFTIGGPRRSGNGSGKANAE